MTAAKRSERFAVKSVSTGGHVVATDYVHGRDAADALAARLTQRPVAEVAAVEVPVEIPHLRGATRGSVRIVPLELIA